MNIRPDSSCLAEAERVSRDDLPGAEVPRTPGTYCWHHLGRPVYVAATDDLHRQLKQLEVRARQRPVPPFRQFARGQLGCWALLGRASRRRRGSPP